MGRFHVAVFGMRSENSTYSLYTTAFADFRPMTSTDELREHYAPVTTAGAGQRLDLEPWLPRPGSHRRTSHRHTAPDGGAHRATDHRRRTRASPAPQHARPSSRFCLS